MNNKIKENMTNNVIKIKIISSTSIITNEITLEEANQLYKYLTEYLKKDNNKKISIM